MRAEVLSCLLASATITGSAAVTPDLDHDFQQVVRPFIVKYCSGCHSGKSAAAQLDLKAYTDLNSVARDYPRWALVSQRLSAREMPPKPLPPPPANDAGRVIAWIQAVRAEQI